MRMEISRCILLRQEAAGVESSSPLPPGLSVLPKKEPASPWSFQSDPLHPQGSEEGWSAGQVLLCEREVDFPGAGREGGWNVRNRSPVG